MPSVMLSSPEMLQQLNANLDFIGRFNPELKARLASCRDAVVFDDAGNLLIDGRLALASVQAALSTSFRAQLTKPSRVRMAQVQNNAEPLPLSSLAQEVVDQHGGRVLASLPNLNASAIGSQQEPSAPRDLLLLGSLMLQPLQAVLAQQQAPGCLTSLTLAESDPHQLLALLHLLDLESFVGLCKKLAIGFHLIVESQALLLQESIYVYLSNAVPLALHQLQVLESPLRHPALSELRGWLFAQSGIGYRFLGTLGSTTDEINQLMAAAWNALSSASARWLHPPLNAAISLARTAVVVGSGPSLESELDWLAAHREQLTVLAAGSGIGSLLRAGIVPDAVVLLERSSTVVDDLMPLVEEGYSLKGIRLFASITTDPRLRELFGDVYLFQRPVSTAIALFPGLEKTAALLHAGPESNNAAVDVALHLGFSRLLLLGCDFGAVERRHQRARQAVGHSPRVLDEPVVGNKGRTVFSEPSLLVSRDVVRASVMRYPKVQVRRLGEGVRLDVAADTTYAALEADGWLEGANPWPLIEGQCPAFDPGRYELSVIAGQAREYLPVHAQQLRQALAVEPSHGWSMALHRHFAPLFLQVPAQPLPAHQLVVHRLYRDIMYHLLSPLVRLSPRSPVWSQVLEEAQTSMDYCEALFAGVLEWIEALSIPSVAAKTWDPQRIADELAGILDRQQSASLIQPKL